MKKPGSVNAESSDGREETAGQILFVKAGTYLMGTVVSVSAPDTVTIVTWDVKK